MKKFLSILAAIGMSATAASAVVACGSSNKADSKPGTTPDANGNVTKDFKATFSKQPTNDDLAKDFAVKDSKGKTLEGITYAFKEDAEQKAIVLAQDTNTAVTGTVTVTIPVKSISESDQSVKLTIATTDAGAKVVTNFSPIQISVDATANKAKYMAITIKLTPDVKIKGDNNDNSGEKGDSYITKDAMIDALSEEEAQAIYATLYGTLPTNTSAKDALKADDGDNQGQKNDTFEYTSVYGGTITESNYDTSSVGGTGVGWPDIKPSEHDGKYQMGFYSANKDGTPTNPTHYYWVNLEFTK